MSLYVRVTLLQIFISLWLFIVCQGGAQRSILTLCNYNMKTKPVTSQQVPHIKQATEYAQ